MKGSWICNTFLITFKVKKRQSIMFTKRYKNSEWLKLINLIINNQLLWYEFKYKSVITISGKVRTQIKKISTGILYKISGQTILRKYVTQISI